jgi:acetylornithine aminotransferase
MCRTYSRYPVGVKKACGSRIWDFDGREYIDLLAGLAVTAVGHCNPDVARAVCAQMNKLVHVSNLFYQEEQVILAEKLLGTCHCDRAFFCNSGAEANEAAVKLARRHFQKYKRENRSDVITLTSCFHGRTLGMIAATGQMRLQDGCAPMPAGFKHVPSGDLAALASVMDNNTAAVMFEVIQGEGGVKPLHESYVKGAAELCRKNGCLLIVDEVQAGMGRTGKWWGFQNYGIKPDIFSISKALANGIPMGAMLCTEEASKGFDFGSHASTFGGNALASAAATAVLEAMERGAMLENAARLGIWAKERFKAVGEKCPGTIAEVRGLGLFIGIELAFQGKEVWEKLLGRGFILNLTQERVLRLLPALNLKQEDLEAFAKALEEVLREVE